MSAIHVLNSSDGIFCGQRIVRGFITLKDYLRFKENNTLPTQIKTSITHNCDSRRGNECYKGGTTASCKRTKFSRSRICVECRSRAEYR